MVYQAPDAPVSADYDNHKNRNPPSSEPGTDYALAYGSPLYAPGSGTVIEIKTSNSGGMGRFVAIGLDTGQSTRHIHMSRVDVSTGIRVTKGQWVGLSGASGNNSDWYYGPHVHTTLWPHGYWNDPTIDFENEVDQPEEPEEPDMPLTDQEIEKIAQAVWSYKMSGGDLDNDPNAVAAETGGERLRNIRKSTNNLKSRTEETLEGVNKLVDLIPNEDSKLS